MTEPLSEKLGARLREARERAGMSMEQAADGIGSVARSVARWERGEAEPSFDSVAKLANLYEVSLDWIAGRTLTAAVLKPGMVVVDETAKEILERLVREGGGLADIPRRLIRHPGLDYSFVVPERWMLLGVDAAFAVDARLQELLKQLRRKAR